MGDKSLLQMKLDNLTGAAPAAVPHTQAPAAKTGAKQS